MYYISKQDYLCKKFEALVVIFKNYLKISEELCNGIVNTANTNVITNQNDIENGVGWTPQANKDEVILNVCQLYQRMSL